jgi:hypothetical protein
MTMNVATIVFGSLAAMFLMGIITMLCLPKKIIQSENRWKTLQPEHVAVICLALFVSCAIISACCWLNKCDVCNSFVNTAYCQQCGDVNEAYAERVGEPDANAKCPECADRWRTPYCGDCGKKLGGGK